MSTKKEQNENIEKLFENMDAIIQELESPDISLEKSFELYQEGMKTVKLCNDKISLIEKKVQVLNQNGELNDF